jgi:2-amino-4-hydroxy-6-hydroxymethyldihydropteridine diphosphokinase
MSIATIGFGSSLGDRQFWIEWAMRKLALHPDIRFLRTSRGYRTPPMTGGRATGWFLNSVACFETALPPSDLLALSKQLEALADRRRAVVWGDRTLDVDLLLVGETLLEGPSLTLPHKAWLTRPFVTTPLLEIHPNIRDPRTGKPVRQAACQHGPRAVAVSVLARPPQVT